MSRVGGRKQPPAPLPYRPPPPRSSVPAGPGYLEVKFQPSPDTAQKVTSQAAVKPIREYEDSPPSVRKQAVQLAGSVAAARRKDLEAGLEPVRGAGASAATAQPSKPLAVPAAVSAAAPTDMGALLVMRARADFAAIETGDLSFSKGDLIVVTNTHGQDLASGAGWWTGHREDEPGITGDFPSNYMEKQPAAQIAAPESAAVAMATAGPSPGPQPGLGVPLGSEPEPEPELVVVPGAINEVNPGRLWCVPRVPVAEMRIGEFCDGFAEKFELRVGPNYQRNGRKEPSGPALYDFVGATLLHSPAKLDDLLGSLPDLIPPSHRAGKPVPPAGSAVPEYFLLNVQLPCGAAVTFNKPLDGETMNLAFLWRVSAHVVENLESGELSPPVALLEKYCKIAPTIKGPKAGFRGRAKLVAKADPIPDAMPSMLHGYNGKPVLLSASSDVSVGTAPGEAGGNSYMEIDCNVRHWNLVARKSIASLWDAAADLGLEIGICIESREDEEMPEQILGCAQVKNFSWGMAIEHNA